MKKVVYILFIVLIASCKKHKTDKIDYKQEMRTFVQNISIYAKGIRPGFVVIPQNGEQLLTITGLAEGALSTSYIQAIDGIGREDLFYGYDADDSATPTSAKAEMLAFTDIAKNNGLKVLVTDYCSTTSKMNDSYVQNYSKGYISFSADHRELDNIPSYPSTSFRVDTNDINLLSDAQNFLYIINTANYESKASFISAVASTNYDVIIMDINFNNEFFNSSEINMLKQKANGGLRKVICYMSIGEAENYRYYWQSFWNATPPQFIVAENAQWAGNYKVKYWDKEWQSIIYGSSNSYLSRILQAGFDGVYLDIIDGFEYFEN